MKRPWGFAAVAGLALGVGLGLGIDLILAQSSAPEDDLAGLTLVAPEEVPQYGTFWFLQKLDSEPPLPFNPYPELDVYALVPGEVFLVDDRALDYEVIQEQAETEAALLRALGLDEGGAMNTAILGNGLVYPNSSVYLTNLIATRSSGGVSATFSIAGGTNFVPYDIWMTTNLENRIFQSQWKWLGIGYTSNSYTFTNQPMDVAFYAVARPEKTMVTAWGNDFAGQCDVPTGITNALKVTGGGGQSLVLKNDGTVVAWGQNFGGQGTVPTNVVGVAMIASGWYHNVALMTNGSVIAWGYPLSTYHLLDVPTDLTNATVISAQALHSLALRNDGAVVAWGYDGGFGETTVPSGLSNVIAIAAGYQHNLAVKADGTVVAWGNNSSGQTNVPAGLSNAVDVAAGWVHSMALKADGTVIAWGDNYSGATNVPPGLSNVVAIAASGDPSLDTAYSMALRKDGSVVIWGDNDTLTPVGGLNNVIAIGAGADHALAVRTGPLTPVIVQEPTDQFQLAGGMVTFTNKALGVAGVRYQWQFNCVDIFGETNATLTLSNVQVWTEGPYRVIVNNEAGTTISSNASFRLVVAPAIVSQSFSTNPVFVYQTNATLTVLAAAPGQFNGFPLSYQWQLNGTNIAGGTSSNYTFEAKFPGTYSVEVSNVVGSTNAVWHVTINYATFAYHLSTNAVAYAAGYTGSSNDMLQVSRWTNAWPVVYSDTNNNMGLLTNAVWSTNFWLKGVQGLSATAIGISNNPGGRSLVTMVSPRHYLRAYHVGAPRGLIAFLDTNNIIHWRTNIQEADVGSLSVDDTTAGILNADLPPSVSYLSMLPTNFSRYLPTNTSSLVQGIGMNQDMLVFGQPMTFHYINGVVWSNSATSLFGLGTNWNLGIWNGDSSAPERLLINDRLVLVSDNYGGDFGPQYSLKLFEGINQKMHYLSTNNSVGTDYQLTPVLLTNWPVIN